MKTRKGFTLVELLIVIAIMGTLAAMMSISAGSSTATARAAAIYNNIRSIKMTGMIYQVQQGNDFKESEVSDSALSEVNPAVDINNYNTGNITYTIEAGTDDETSPAGAYVVCDFGKDSERAAILKALKGYKDLRVPQGDEIYKAGAYIFHFTATTKDDDADYEVDDMLGESNS